MDIRIKHISILNFKGIRSFEADFDSSESEYRGDNATGKTTLFDAFSWCMYGKDSAGRSDTNFQLKTLDKDNRVIPKIPHEVTVILSVDGSEIRLRKCYNEEWKKRRGSAEEQFTGHTIERFWNDVPCSEREYNEKIAAICPEDVFRLITNPTFFLSMPKKEQRSFLMNMAGDITYDDIAAKYPEFRKLVSDMTGKTVEEYAKEIGAKIKRIKAEMEGIPQRIDERKRDMPEKIDTQKVQEQIDVMQKMIDAVDSQLADKAKAYAESNKHRQELIIQRSELEMRLSARESEIRSNIMRDWYEKSKKKDDLTRDLQRMKDRHVSVMDRLRQLLSEKQEKESLRQQYLTEWREISARQLPEMNEDDFKCPTCGRKLENDDIAEKVIQISDRFHAQKARDLEVNKKKGLSVKADIERLSDEQERMARESEDLQGAIARMENDPSFRWNEPETDAAPYLSEDPKVISYRQQIDSITRELEQPAGEPDQSALKQEKMDLLEKKQEFVNLLITEETRQRSEERIAELERQWQSQNEEIADLEGTQYQIDLFKHRMVDDVEEKINSMFQIVRFKMYEQQVNGGERETCEAIVDGVPYSTNLNMAARINAGIDVINAISRLNKVSAPIFIDNRESITKVLHTESQVINLIKDERYQSLTCII